MFFFRCCCCLCFSKKGICFTEKNPQSETQDPSYGCFSNQNMGGKSTPQNGFGEFIMAKPYEQMDDLAIKMDDFCGGKTGPTIFGFSSIWFIIWYLRPTRNSGNSQDRLVVFNVKKSSPESNHQNVFEYKSTRRIKWSTPPFMSDAWKYMEAHEKIIFLITSILCKKSSTVGFPRESKDIAISIPVIYQSNGRIRDYKSYQNTKTQSIQASRVPFHLLERSCKT